MRAARFPWAGVGRPFRAPECRGRLGRGRVSGFEIRGARSILKGCHTKAQDEILGILGSVEDLVHGRHPDRVTEPCLQTVGILAGADELHLVVCEREALGLTGFQERGA